LPNSLDTHWFRVTLGLPVGAGEAPRRDRLWGRPDRANKGKGIHIMAAQKVRLYMAAAALAVAAGAASGNIVDLTVNQTGTINGALFERTDFRPAGTGFINSFVRIQNTGVEEGYNTSGRPVAFDELTDPNFTRNITVGDVPIVNIMGMDYYEFRLDINEPVGGGMNLLSLDMLQVYTSGTGSQTTSNVSSLGMLQYDLDEFKDSHVLLDYNLNSGSGQGDMLFLLPTSALGGVAGTDFLYLYSKFGVTASAEAEAGFEEWSIREGQPIIPLPPAALIGGLGLLTAGFVRQVRKHR
jgi:hypothetical protein